MSRPVLVIGVPLGVALTIGVLTGRHGRDPAVGDGSHIRNAALARAQVLLDHKTLGSEIRRNPADLAEIGSDDLVSCRYEPDSATGTTPKFDCTTGNGETIKVKYGKNPEIPAEIAASRLLSALGFGADSMYHVRRVRCYGCPSNPFRVQQATDLVRGDRLLRKTLDYEQWSDFEWAAIERRHEAPPITSAGAKGWAWWELDRVDPTKGGASLAELDAFRLTAVFLAHWDNKSENQRLICLSGEPDGERCARPFAMIQDAGATFGPPKANLDGWRAVPIWDDAAACTVSMRMLPHDGATFGDVTISEAGRRLLGARLVKLSEAQIRDLIVGARLADFDGSAKPGEIDGWVTAFLEKRRAIIDRPPCPS